MHLSLPALLPRPGMYMQTQNFLKQLTEMSMGGTPVMDCRSELLASISFFFFTSMRLMGMGVDLLTNTYKGGQARKLGTVKLATSVLKTSQVESHDLTPHNAGGAIDARCHPSHLDTKCQLPARAMSPTPSLSLTLVWEPLVLAPVSCKPEQWRQANSHGLREPQPLNGAGWTTGATDVASGLCNNDHLWSIQLIFSIFSTW